MSTATRVNGRAPASAATVVITVDQPGHYRVAPDGAVERLHRSEVPAIIARPQPEPLATHADNIYGVVRLVRFWKNKRATQGCRLCPLCHAFRRKGKTVCVVLAPPTSTYADVNPFTVREQGVDGQVLDPERAEEEIHGGSLDSYEYKIDFARVRPTSRVDARDDRTGPARLSEPALTAANGGGL